MIDLDSDIASPILETPARKQYSRVVPDTNSERFVPQSARSEFSDTGSETAHELLLDVVLTSCYFASMLLRNSAFTRHPRPAAPAMFRRLGAAGLAVALVGFVGASTAAPPASAECSTFTLGHWEGTWSSTAYPGAGGGLSADVHIQGTTVTGTIHLTNSYVSSAPISGQLSCSTIEFGVAGGLANFSGRVGVNGTSASGTYSTTLYSDAGVWSLTMTAEPGYVSLGDSYSSGEGLNQYEETPYSTTTNGCHRSKRGYPAVQTRKTTRDPWTWIVLPNVAQRTRRACSGAVIDSITLGTSNGGEPEQIASVGSATQFVSLTIGGNDTPIEFDKILKGCAHIEVKETITGIERAAWLIDRKVDEESCSSRLTAVAGDGAISDLRVRLANTYRKILDRVGPNTKVRIVTYPKLFPDDTYVGVSGTNGSHQCRVAGLSFGDSNVTIDSQITFSPEDVAAFNRAQQRMNATIAAAVGDMQDARIQITDIYSRLSEHPVDCGPSDNYKPMINGVRFAKGNLRSLAKCLITIGTSPICNKISDSFISRASFHPNAAGQKEMAIGINASFAG